MLTEPVWLGVLEDVPGVAAMAETFTARRLVTPGATAVKEGPKP
jgi:hypothetical protein